MTRVPPELDRLMWAIAEENSPGAADEFIRRYPIYREELLRRQTAVAGLRSSKPGKAQLSLGPRVKAIPQFTPRELRRIPPEPRQVWIASFLALAALAGATFTVTSLLAPHPAPLRTPPKQTPPKQTPLGPLQLPRAPVVEKETARTPRDPESAGPPQSGPTQARAQANPDRPQTLVVKRAALKDVFKMLSLQSGVDIVLAPGMPDPEVSVDYRDVTPMAILRDLGTQYRFTPFDQGDGSIVVYPAVDPHAGDPAPTSGSLPVRRIGG